MIDFHTHSLLSDGVLIPSELVRRAQVAGYRAIAITDHVDHSNIEPVLSGLSKVSAVLSRYWDILVLPGVEITHVPLEAFSELVALSRKLGAKVVVGHGESPAEPVLEGTNAAAINAGVDILAHPGFISEKDAELAKDNEVYLEITTRRGHSEGNENVFTVAQKVGAKLILNTDSHAPGDLLSKELIDSTLSALTDSVEIKAAILENSEKLLIDIEN